MYINAYAKFYWNSSTHSKILSKNAFWTWIKGHITMFFLNEIIPLVIPYHSFPIPMSMQYICKILLNFVYSFLRYWPSMHFGHKSRTITLLFLNEIIPLAIPYHPSPIPMSMQSLKKIGKKVLKLEHENEALTDRQTDRHWKFGGYNIIPRHFLCGGV